MSKKKLPKLDLRRNDLKDQWNKLSAYYKKKFMEESMDKVDKVIQALFRKGGSQNENLAKRIIKSKLKFEGEYGKSGTILNKAVNEEFKHQKKIAVERKIEINRNIRQRKALRNLDNYKKIYDKAGYGIDEHSLFIGDIVNPMVYDKGFDAYLELRRLENEVAKAFDTDKYIKDPKMLEYIAKANWDNANKIITNIGQKDFSAEHKRTVDETIKQLEKYFIDYQHRKELLAQVRKYTDYMSPHDIAQLPFIIWGEKFREEWDSDQERSEHNGRYVNYSSEMGKRAEKLLSILRNHTRKNVVLNGMGNAIERVERWTPVGDETMEKYLV